MKKGTESWGEEGGICLAAFRLPCDWEIDDGGFRTAVSDTVPLQVSKSFLDPNFNIGAYFNSRRETDIYPPVHGNC